MARRDITGAVDFAYLQNYAAGDLDLVDEVLGRTAVFPGNFRLFPMPHPPCGVLAP